MTDTRSTLRRVDGILAINMLPVYGLRRLVGMAANGKHMADFQATLLRNCYKQDKRIIW